MKAPKWNQTLLVSIIAKSQDIGKEIVTNVSASDTGSPLSSISNVLPVLNDKALRDYRSSSHPPYLSLLKYFPSLGMSLF